MLISMSLPFDSLSINIHYLQYQVLKSSAFEGMLLRATWPNSQPVQPDILGELIKYSIPAFEYNAEVSVYICVRACVYVCVTVTVCM